MAHDFNYRIGGTVLVPTYARAVIAFEGVAGKRAEFADIAYQHGVYVASRHWTESRIMKLRTILSQATQQTYHQQLEGLKALLYGTGGNTSIRTLQRNDPAAGEVESLILVSDPTEQQDGDGRMVLDWPVMQLKGYWSEPAATSQQDAGVGTIANLTTANVGGNHPTEPVITFECVTDGANPAVTDPATGDTLVAAGSFVAGDTVIIDVPERIVTKNGTRIKNLLTINRGYWMEFAADTAIDLDFTADSGTWDVTVAWKDRHR